ASAFLMVQRAAGIALLPARGDRSGLREAVGSTGLATAAGSVWLFIDPAVFPAAFAAALLLSWPGRCCEPGRSDGFPQAAPVAPRR
ncbi:MAG: hypothetical protein AAGF82_13225, partial [Pseudomonadota bacterium]